MENSIHEQHVAEARRVSAEIANSDGWDELAQQVSDIKLLMARGQADKDDILGFCEDARKALDEIEDQVWGDGEALSDPDADTEEEKAGPFVVLLSDHYWARASSFVKARARLHGEVPRLAYLTNDKTSFVDGLGSFAFDQKSTWFKLPLMRKMSGPNRGKPGTVEFWEPREP